MAITIEIVDAPSDDIGYRCNRCQKLSTSLYHLHVCPRIGTPPPPIELGKNLQTVEDVQEWLGHPDNQLWPCLFVVEWKGHVPYVNVEHVERLWENDIFAEVTLDVQARKKRGRQDEFEVVREPDGT